MQSLRNSLLTRFLVGQTVALLVAFGLAGVLTLAIGRSLILTRAREDLLLETENLRRQVRGFFGARANEMTLLADLDFPNLGSPSDSSQHLQALLARSRRLLAPAYDALALTDSSGIPIASTDDAFGRTWERASWREGLALVSVQVGPAQGRVVQFRWLADERLGAASGSRLLVRAPVFASSSDARPSAFLEGRIAAETMSDLLLSRHESSPSDHATYAAILTGNARVIAGQLPESWKPGDVAALEETATSSEDPMEGSGSFYAASLALRGGRVDSDGPLRVVAFRHRQQALSVLGTFVFGTLAALLIGLLLALGLSIRMSERLSRRIQVLVEGTKRLAKGTFDHRVDLTEVGELAPLGHAFNTMASELEMFQVGLRNLIEQLERQSLDLSQSEERSRLILETALDAIVTVDQDGSVQEFNQAAARMFGRTRAEAIGCSIRDILLIGGSSADGHGELLRAVLSGDPRVMGKQFGVSAQRADGTIFPAEMTASVLLMKEAYSIVFFVRDITAASAAEQAIRDSEYRYRLLFEHNPHPMWLYDGETLRFIAVNDAAVATYGFSREEFLERSVHDVHVEMLAAAESGDRASASPAQRRPSEARHRRRDGTLIQVRTEAHPTLLAGRLVVLVMITDVSEERRLEGLLQVAQRMEAVGRLAGGIAHDFNNLLTAIVGYGQMLCQRLEAGSRERAQAEEILKAGERAGNLTRQLLAFSRKQVVEPRAINLNTTLREMENLLSRLIGENVRIVTRLAGDLGTVCADPGQVEQVIVNLIVNARDAMLRGGTVSIETRNVEIPNEAPDAARQLPAGSYVELAVSDTGDGMDAETRAHIFEPFFTTKGPGQGTGLGLATVYGILQQAGGWITVESEPGRGSAFRAYLPRVEAAVDPAGSSDPGEIRERAPRGETILLVEDEELVRNLAREVLVDAGFDVLEAHDGERGLEIAALHPGRIDLVLTDVIMPGMNGREVAERLLTRWDDILVLFMSGYTDDEIVRTGVLVRDFPFLHKPFTPKSLVAKVVEVLENRRQAA